MTTTERYGPGYRLSETMVLTDYIRRGVTCTLLGVAGVGMSNLTTALMRRHQEISTGRNDASLKVHYVYVECTNWDGTKPGWWALLYESTKRALHTSLPGSSTYDEVQSFSGIESLFRGIFTGEHQRLCIILDDADVLLRDSPAEILAQLYGLRQHFKDYLNYLVLVERFPYRIRPTAYSAPADRFLTLCSEHMYALTTYNAGDALHMLTFLNDQTERPLSPANLRSLYEMSGGHAKLARGLFEYFLFQLPDEAVSLSTIASTYIVSNACRAILRSLHQHESQTLRKLALRQKPVAHDMPAIWLLQKRGLLGIDEHTITIPLLEEHLRSVTDT